MRNLKRNSFILFTHLAFISGCTTTSYQIHNQKGSLTELVVSPDRVLVECEFITEYSGDLKDPHGFMIHILDEENTVLTVSQGNVLDKDVCFDRLNAVSKMLKTGKGIYIGGHGDITEPREKTETKYTFPGLGTFYQNGRHLMYFVAWTEDGQCFDAYEGDRKPCPRDEFPIKN